jgi:hypothetical protein
VHDSLCITWEPMSECAYMGKYVHTCYFGVHTLVGCMPSLARGHVDTEI